MFQSAEGNKQRDAGNIQRQSDKQATEAENFSIKNYSNQALLGVSRASRASKMMPIRPSQKPVVINQSAPSSVSVQRKAWVGNQVLSVDETYKKTVKDTWGEKALARLIELHTDSMEHRFANWGELIAEYERAKKTATPASEKKDEDSLASLPGYGQFGPSCAGASLITPVLIWDNEHYTSSDPNPRLISVLAKMKAYMLDHRKELEPRLDNVAKQYFQKSINLFDAISDAATNESFKLSSLQYEQIGLRLMLISQTKLKDGLDEGEMQKARQILGIHAVTTPVRHFNDLFKSDGDLVALKPGQMAQVTWLVDKRKLPEPSEGIEPHAFTIGRLKDGTWILNDQGYPKPIQLKGSDLATLKDAMMDASDNKKWWGVTDEKVNPVVEKETGYTILGDEKTLKP